MAKLSKEEKRNKRALRSYRGRFFKNLLIWFIGLITMPALIAGGIYLGIGVLPLSTYTGGEQNAYVSEELSKKNLLEVIKTFNQYGVADFPIISDLVDSLVNGAGLGEYVEVDQEKLKMVKFSYEDGSTDFMTEFQACIKVTATLNSVGGTGLLGDFGKLSAFSEWEKVEDAEKPQTDDSGNIKKDGETFLSNPKMYYYDTTEASGVSGFNASSAQYARAFDDNGVRVAPAGAKLYFPNLSEIPVLDAFDVIGESFGRLKVTELLEMSGSTIEEDSFIDKILGGKSISDVGEINPDEIMLADVLKKTDDNEKLYDILCAATGVATADELNIGDLKEIDIDSVLVEKVLDNTVGSNADTIELIVNSINQKNAGVAGWVDIGTAPDSERKLTIGDISSFDTNYIKLSKVLDTTENATTYSLLCEAINAKKGYTGDAVRTAETLTINDLSDFDTDYVKLSSVMTPSADLENILKDATGKEYENIYVTDLNEFTADDINLATVMQTPDEHLKDILEDVYHKEYAEITVSDLGSFQMGELHLYKVLSEPNDKLKEILIEACGTTSYDDITVSMLNNTEGSFNINDIHLGTVIDKDSIDNPILKALLEKNPKISGIGSAMDTLKLYDVYGTKCFYKSETVPDGYGDKSRYSYNESTGVYTLDMANGDYYISDTAGIWLLICFDASGLSVEGRAESYTASNSTVGDLENNVSSSITDATVRQLIDAGILSSANSALWGYTLEDALT
ncbi:MAG: hypothetical protein IKA11_01630 [Clostridia bacterium]|nr:hypothetical protein [Clostridia bacterium]